MRLILPHVLSMNISHTSTYTIHASPRFYKVRVALLQIACTDTDPTKNIQTQCHTTT